MNIFGSTWTAVVGAVLLVLMAIGIGQYIENVNLEKGLAESQRDLKSEREGYEQQALIKEQQYRTKEAQIHADQAQVVAQAATQASQAASDAAGARDELKRLRDRAIKASGGGQAACHSSIAASSAAAPDPEFVRAELLDRVGQAALDLAAIADQRGIAGQACVNAYQALTKEPQ